MKTHKEIRKILSEIDPYNLIKIGAPEDEYDSEAALIDRFLLLGGKITPAIIQKIFENQGLSISSLTADIIYRRLS